MSDAYRVRRSSCGMQQKRRQQRFDRRQYERFSVIHQRQFQVLHDVGQGYPYAPSSFTGSPTSDTEGSTLPKLETVKRGVINLADYANLGAWCTFSKFDAKRLTDEEDAKIIIRTTTFL